MTNDSTIGVRDVLIWLSGGDPELLEQSPADRARHIAYGMMFLVTAAFAAISGTFALNMMMHLSWPVAAIFGIGWGIMILAIDRMLVLSMPRPKGFRGFLVSTLTVALRVGMALVLGAVVSTPLILRVFEPEIAVEIQVMHAEEVAAYKQQLDADPRFSSMPDLRQEIAQQQAIVDAGASASTENDPAVVRARAAVKSAETVYAEAEQEVVCEKEGTCGSGRAGAGIAFDEKVRIRENAWNNLQSARSDLESALATASTTSLAQSRNEVASTKEQLADNKEELADLEADRAALDRDQEAAVANSNGLIARLEGLHRLIGKSPSLATAHHLLLALFMIIETLPVLTKTLQFLAPRSLYEKLTELRDGDTLAEASKASDHRQEVDRMRADLLLEAEQDLCNERLEAEKDVNARVVAKQKAVTAMALDAWELKVSAQAVEEISRWEPPRTTHVIDLE